MPAANDVVWLDVLPSMKGFGPALEKGVGPEADKAGKKAGTGFGKAALAATAVVAGGAVLATKALYNIGATFDDVADTIRVGTGATGKALDGLVESAKNVGRNVPADFESVGTVVADVNTRMGLTGETLEKVASQYLEAGRILGQEIDIAKTSAAFNAFGIEGEAVSGAMDHLFRVSQATGVGINELAATAQSAAPAMMALGFSFEETAALAGNLDKAGINSSKMMAGMSRALVELAKDGEKPQDAFKRVTGEIQGFIDKGDTASAIDLASKLFGTRNASQFVGALQTGALAMDDLGKVAGMTEDAILGAGAETMDFAEQWQMFKNNILAELEPIATRVFTAIGDGMKWLKDEGIPALKDFGKWLGENKDTLIVVGAAVGTVIAGLAIYTATVKVVTAVTTAWNVIQKVLNGTLRANPIGIVVTVLALLVGALILAYNKSETFRNIVQNAWAKIQQAVSRAWKNVISPAFNALVGFITGTLVPAVQWLWQRVIQPAFKAIATAVQWAWNNVIKPAFAALVRFVRNVLAPTALWLWNNVMKPAWAGIQLAIKIAWNVIRLIFDAIKFYVEKVLAPVVRWLWNNVVKPVWDGISKTISTVWNKGIKPVLSALGDFITKTVAPAFRKGVDAIKSAWDSIRNAAIKPINFVIETVYNKGIKGTFDKIASAVGSKVRLPYINPLGLAPSSTSGRGTSRNVAARAKGGWTRPGWVLVGEEGPELVDFRTPGRVYTASETALMTGGQHRNGDGFGGPLDWIGSAKDWVLGNLKKLAMRAVDGVMSLMDNIGGGALGGLAKSAVRKAADLLLGWAGEKDAMEGTAASGKIIKGNGTGSQASLVAFARLMQSMGARVSEHPAFGGVTQGAHATNSKHYSGRALDVNYGPGGENAIEKAFFDKVVAQGLPQSYGLRTIWRAPGHFNHMHVDYDQGGWLKPGMSLIRNATGKPEAILNPNQWRAVETLAARGAGGPQVEQHIHAAPRQSEYEIATIANRQLGWAVRS